MTATVVIPACNEAATIADVATRALANCLRVIVVDDGSTDATASQLAALPVTVVRHASNRGKAEALRTGMTCALEGGAEAVITLDGDGQHRPEDIPRLNAAHRRTPGALILASRTIARENAPGLRRFANRQADFWISWAAGVRIRDTQSGFRLYPAALLVAVLPACAGRGGFVFESEILIESVRRGFTVESLPIEALYPEKARPSHYRPMADTVRIIRMVAGKLLARGMYLQGLRKSLGY